MKYHEGDHLLVYGQYHVEKATITKVEKGFLVLDNQMKVDRDLKVLNAKSAFTVENWDENKYKFLHYRSMMEKKISQLQNGYRKLDQDALIRVYEKLDRLIGKYL